MYKNRKNSKEAYQLKDNGFNPYTIIDVGVAKGTPDLYDVFPDSFFYLIEPLKEFESDLIKILRTLKLENIF